MKYRIGRKQKRVILDEQGLEIAIFFKGHEELAQQTCDFLNTRKSNVCNHYSPGEDTLMNCANCGSHRWLHLGQMYAVD